MKVTFNPNTCIHSGNCVKTLPTVFKVKNGELKIDLNDANEEDVRRVVSECPSGALQIKEDKS